MKCKLVSDDSGHDYVIPSDRSEEWYSLDFENDDLPDWAIMIGGGLEFEDPTEFGKPIFFNPVEYVPEQPIHDGLLEK